ncbi:MAG: RNA polymerase sigma factor [Bacteroidota bacterium]
MKPSKEQQFEVIYQAHQYKVYRLCLGYTGNTVDADDLYQQIMLKIWTHLDSFRGESQLSTWIYRISTNTALLYQKRQYRQREKQKDLKPTANPIFNPSEQMERKAQVNQLYKAIAQLKEIDRIIISLVLEERTYQEIAEITGLSSSHVGVKINRIKKELKKMMDHARRI